MTPSAGPMCGCGRHRHRLAVRAVVIHKTPRPDRAGSFVRQRPSNRHRAGPPTAPRAVSSSVGNGEADCVDFRRTCALSGLFEITHTCDSTTGSSICPLIALGAHASLPSWLCMRHMRRVWIRAHVEIAPTPRSWRRMALTGGVSPSVAPARSAGGLWPRSSRTRDTRSSSCSMTSLPWTSIC